MPLRLPEEPDTPLQINIVPMIDVIFAILIFFILASLLLTNAEQLPVNLPTAASGTPQTPTSVSLTIDSEGNLAVNGEAVSSDQLTARIADQMELPGTVIIQADEQASHGSVIAVMDQLRSLEGVQLAIATQPPTSP